MELTPSAWDELMWLFLEVAAKAAPSTHRTCKNCSGHMAKDASKCTNCGKTWESAATPSGANSPYKILKHGNKWTVVNNTGETKSTFDSHDKALAYLRALYANVGGAAKRAEKVKFSGKAKQRIPKGSGRYT